MTQPLRGDHEPLRAPLSRKSYPIGAQVTNSNQQSLRALVFLLQYNSNYPNPSHPNCQLSNVVYQLLHQYTMIYRLSKHSVVCIWARRAKFRYSVSFPTPNYWSVFQCKLIKVFFRKLPFYNCYPIIQILIWLFGSDPVLINPYTEFYCSNTVHLTLVLSHK